MAKGPVSSPRHRKVRDDSARPVKPGKKTTQAARGFSPTRIDLRQAVLNELEPSERDALLSVAGEAFLIYELMNPGPRGRRYLELCDRGWAGLRLRLIGGNWIARARKEADPFSQLEVVPASSWQRAIPNYEKWVVRIGTTTIVDIEIETIPTLFVSEKSQQALLGSVDLQLTGSLLSRFLKLAKGAKASRANGLVKFTELKTSNEETNQRVTQDFYKIKRQMKNQGIDEGLVDYIFKNVPNQGYRVGLPAAAITTEEEAKEPRA